MNNVGTSTPEQSIFYYVRRFFPDAQNRYRFQTTNGCFEIDVYIPSIKVAIEYDGAFWHKDKDGRDASKNYALNEAGVYVIRIRDLDCPPLPNFYGKIFYHGKSPKGMHTNECIESVIRDIAQFCTDENLAKQLQNFNLTYKEYRDDLPDIAACFFPHEVEENKSQLCGAEFWDSQANGKLSLENIPATDTKQVYANFICKSGYKIHAKISVLRNKKECGMNCKECFSSICPFIGVCENRCKILKGFIDDYLLGGELHNEKFFKSHLWRFHLERADYLINFITQGVQFKDDSNYRKRFEAFFITGNQHKLFYGSHFVKINTENDLLTIREFYATYHAIVNCCVSNLETTEENRLAIKEYLQWAYDTVEQDQCIIIGQWLYHDWLACKVNGNPMCDDLKTIIVQFINKIEVRYNYNFRVKFD